MQTPTKSPAGPASWRATGGGGGGYAEDGIGSPRGGKAYDVASPSRGVVRGSAVCICQMCVCGNHHCPAASLARPVPFSSQSSHQIDYVPHCPQHGALAAAPAAPRPSLPFTATTSYRADYVPLKVDVAAPAEAPAYRPSTFKFDAVSESRAQFTPKQAEAPLPAAPLPAAHPGARFSATSSYAADYRPWELQPAPPLAPSPSRAASMPFSGLSEHAREYGPKAMLACPASLLPQPPMPAAARDAWTSDGAGQAHVLYDRSTGKFGSP